MQIPVLNDWSLRVKSKTDQYGQLNPEEMCNKFVK